MLKLISASPSPYARKVRIALAEKGIPFELITEVPWDSTTQTPQHNPLEKLPVLILPADSGATNGANNGSATTADPRLHPSAVYESHYILEYLETKHPLPALLPSDPDAALFARRVEVVADGVADALVLRFFERQRDEGVRSAAWEARQMRKVDGGLRALAEWVVDGEGKVREFIIGNRLSIADLAVASVCGWLRLRFSEYGLEGKLPKLAQYCDRLEERKSFKDTVPSPQTIKDKVV